MIHQKTVAQLCNEVVVKNCLHRSSHALLTNFAQSQNDNKTCPRYEHHRTTESSVVFLPQVVYTSLFRMWQLKKTEEMSKLKISVCSLSLKETVGEVGLCGVVMSSQSLTCSKWWSEGSQFGESGIKFYEGVKLTSILNRTYCTINCFWYLSNCFMKHNISCTGAED